jgi:voltage-gated potassium channel Kch
VISGHGKFDEQLLRVRADEDERRVRLPVRKLVAVVFLAQAVDDVHAAQEAAGRKERRKVNPLD